MRVTWPMARDMTRTLVFYKFHVGSISLRATFGVRKKSNGTFACRLTGLITKRLRMVLLFSRVFKPHSIFLLFFPLIPDRCSIFGSHCTSHYSQKSVDEINPKMKYRKKYRRKPTIYWALHNCMQNRLYLRVNIFAKQNGHCILSFLQRFLFESDWNATGVTP